MSLGDEPRQTIDLRSHVSQPLAQDPTSWDTPKPVPLADRHMTRVASREPCKKQRTSTSLVAKSRLYHVFTTVRRAPPRTDGQFAAKPSWSGRRQTAIYRNPAFPALDAVVVLGRTE